MEADFWLERWQRGEIGFHLPRTHPKLLRYWSDVAGSAEKDAAVLVPLCGKTLDMRWLADQGHAVCGVELSQQALDEFVGESELALSKTGAGYVGAGWQLHSGDWFEFAADQPFSLFYDRAALIALPASMRKRYVSHLLDQLADQAAGLLITLEYSQSEMTGPPFSVQEDEVRQLFSGYATVTELHRADILEHEPRFRERGLSQLQEVVWRIELAAPVA